MIVLPVFAPPAFVTQDSTQSGLRVLNVRAIQVAGPPIMEIHAKYGYEYTGIRLEYQPVEFARALGKIAYAFAVLKLGLERMSETYVLAAILGETSDIGQWVGCDPGAPVGLSTGLHAVSVRIDHKEIHVFVRLFAQFEAPEYHVVVGRVR